LAGIIDIMGEEQGLDLARKLTAQKLRLQRGHSLLTQLVVAGELKVIADSYHFQLQGFKEKGAPVDFTVPDPMIIKDPSGTWISKRAPHPHAAALLIDFLFSPEGQKVYADLNRLSARKDIDWDFGGKRLKRVHVLSAEKWGSRYNSLIKQFDEIFRKGG
ncbi:MAG: ABC transporter substrate-binding protein, partial [Candidatus Binatia bacterium]